MGKTFYAKGGAVGSGSSAADPLGIERADTWQLVEETARSEPVVIRLVGGLHTEKIQVADRGFSNRVSLVSDKPGAAHLYTMEVVRSSNLEINGLTWVNPPPAPAGKTYGTGLGIGDRSRDVDVVDCLFRDLTNRIDGSHAEQSAHHIRYIGCIFENIGSGGGDHLMYHNKNAHHISLSNCTFKDCPGDYVRFRDNVHHCVVDDCLFENTGRYPAAKTFFIVAYVNNDKQPGTVDAQGEYPAHEVPDEERHVQYEMFGTDFIVSNSRFVGVGDPFRFAHSGWHFPGHDYLLRPDEAQALNAGGPREQQALLRRKYGIHFERMMMVKIDAERDALCWFSTTPAPGSGGEPADIDITTLINHGAHTGKITAITLDHVGCYVELDSTGGIQWVIEKATHENYDAIVPALLDSAERRKDLRLRLRREIGRSGEILYMSRRYSA